ncbi:CBS domain-containing protein [Bowmanella pacifica]|uniref:CBS domain-containing protein n=1 Tax=Bowmanella pacifica TaxID=502051 RepID=A0A917Z4L9_9ALTE|nr:CBS domain-containing protein [Bowmanella pacifica]GGO73811.1 hypothetical protein GCM10010982_35210 [Bowmanella pacifica]
MTNKILKTQALGQVTQFCATESAEPLNLDSAATKVVTDFTRRSPQLIDKDVSVDQALFMMRKGHVKSKLVVDAEQQFLGIVSFADLNSRKILMIANQRQQDRHELTVEDVMVPRSELHGIRYEHLKNATIADLVDTLRSLGEQHILLTDEQSRLRGLISSSDIARALHIPLDISLKASSFRDIFNVLHEHSELV